MDQLKLTHTELPSVEFLSREDTLAEYAHTAWSGWMEYLYAKSQRNDDGTVTIPADLAKRWWRQMNTPYDLLSDAEKESDKKEARAILALL